MNTSKPKVEVESVNKLI